MRGGTRDRRKPEEEDLTKRSQRRGDKKTKGETPYRERQRLRTKDEGLRRPVNGGQEQLTRPRDVGTRKKGETEGRRSTTGENILSKEERLTLEEERRTEESVKQ